MIATIEIVRRILAETAEVLQLFRESLPWNESLPGGLGLQLKIRMIGGRLRNHRYCFESGCSMPEDVGGG